MVVVVTGWAGDAMVVVVMGWAGDTMVVVVMGWAETVMTGDIAYYTEGAGRVRDALEARRASHWFVAVKLE